MKKQVVNAPRIGGSYSTTTAHATKAGGFVFVRGEHRNHSICGRDTIGDMVVKARRFSNFQSVLRFRQNISMLCCLIASLMLR